MSFDAFSSRSNSSTSVTQSWANSNNQAFSSNVTNDNTGNTTLNIGSTTSSGGGSTGGGWSPQMMIAAAVAVVGAMIWFRGGGGGKG